MWCRCKALETIWGRGFFYVYLGVTCFLTPGHAFFGFYMLIVGIVYLVLYKLTSMHMQKVRVDGCCNSLFLLRGDVL